MIELLGEEQIHMTPKQISEILDMVNKEELLEIEEKIEKALGQAQSKKKALDSKLKATSSIENVPSTPKENDPATMVEQVRVRDAEQLLSESPTPTTQPPKAPAKAFKEIADKDSDAHETDADFKDGTEHEKEARRKMSGSQSS